MSVVDCSFLLKSSVSLSSVYDLRNTTLTNAIKVKMKDRPIILMLEHINA